MKKSELKKIIKEEIKKILLEDNIPGGKGDDTIPTQVNQDELEVGIKVEREHTDSDEKAKEIALDHLTEDPSYYSKLIDANLVDEKSALTLAKKLKVGDPVKEAIRKEIKNTIKEYFNDEQTKNIIKKSELKNIIREEIINLLNELK